MQVYLHHDLQYYCIIAEPSSIIGTRIFRKHLFPELSMNDDDDEYIIDPELPLLNHMTRRILAESIFFLVKDDEAQYKAILHSMAELVPYSLVEDGMLHHCVHRDLY